MRNLAKICAVVALCLGVTGGARATDRPRPGLAKARMGRPSAGVSAARTPVSRPSPSAGRSTPLAMVSAPQTPLSFGQVVGPGPTRLKAETTARVAANCPFHLMASFQGFVRQAAGREAIPPKLMKVTINGKEVPVGTNRVLIATGGPTPAAGAQVPVVIEMDVKGAYFYPEGRYGGNLALTAIAGP